MTDTHEEPDTAGAEHHSVHQRSEDPAYAALAASDDFAELRKRYRAFAFPWTVAFLSWYLLYVVMSNWANDLMNTRVVGHINVALVFGLLQFVSTFSIAYLYSRHASRSLDPLAGRLEERYEQTRAQTNGGRD